MSHNMFVGSGKRSGTRGGADQFSWEKVKGDKYKDFYLGHSLHTTAKPTFNNRKPNPLWWTKAQEGSNGEVDDAARRRAEIAAIKREEEQLHQEALGLAPRRRKAQETQLDSNEIQELTRRGNTERDAYDAERVAGLGFAPAPQHQTDAALLPATSRSAASGEGEGGDAERRTGRGRPDTGESRDEWEEAPGNDLTTTTTTRPKQGDKKDPSSRSSSRRDKEERREEKRRRKEEKRKKEKEKVNKDKRSGKERSERDKHARTGGSDRSRGREAGDNDRKRRLHGDEHGREERSRHRRDTSASRSPKRRRHDSPSPPARRRSRHDSP